MTNVNYNCYAADVIAYNIERDYHQGHYFNIEINLLKKEKLDYRGITFDLLQTQVRKHVGNLKNLWLQVCLGVRWLDQMTRNI